MIKLCAKKERQIIEFPVDLPHQQMSINTNRVKVFYQSLNDTHANRQKNRNDKQVCK